MQRELNQLPRWFAAQVSGRQLLGLVRFQQQAQLGTSQPDTTGALHSGSGPPCQLPRSLGEPHTGNRTIVSELPPSSRAAQPKPSAPRSTPPHTNADSPLEVTLGGRVVARAVRTPAGVSAAVAEAVHGTAGFPAVARCPSDGSLLQDVISIFVQPEHSGAGVLNPPPPPLLSPTGDTLILQWPCRYMQRHTIAIFQIIGHIICHFSCTPLAF